MSPQLSEERITLTANVRLYPLQLAEVEGVKCYEQILKHSLVNQSIVYVQVYCDDKQFQCKQLSRAGRLTDTECFSMTAIT